jgi:crossover junction endodeoxyribonuclease RusA
MLIDRLKLDFPPSINGYWRSVGKRQILSERGRKYANAMMAAFMTRGRVKKVIDHSIGIHVVLCVPDRRARDVDNYAKAVFDGLTKSGYWVDDSLIKCFIVSFGERVKGGAVYISVIKSADVMDLARAVLDGKTIDGSIIEARDFNTYVPPLKKLPRARKK